MGKHYIVAGLIILGLLIIAGVVLWLVLRGGNREHNNGNKKDLANWLAKNSPKQAVSCMSALGVKLNDADWWLQKGNAQKVAAVVGNGTMPPKGSDVAGWDEVKDEYLKKSQKLAKLV